MKKSRKIVDEPTIAAHAATVYGDLVDHLIDIAGMATLVETERKGDARGHAQLPTTRVCATTGISGVPFGVHTAWLSISTSG